MFMLSDVDTAAPLALMSANLLSAYRTGAVPGRRPALDAQMRRLSASPAGRDGPHHP